MQRYMHEEGERKVGRGEEGMSVERERGGGGVEEREEAGVSVRGVEERGRSLFMGKIYNTMYTMSCIPLPHIVIYNLVHHQPPMSACQRVKHFTYISIYMYNYVPFNSNLLISYS